MSFKPAASGLFSLLITLRRLLDTVIQACQREKSLLSDRAFHRHFFATIVIGDRFMPWRA